MLRDEKNFPHLEVLLVKENLQLAFNILSQGSVESLSGLSFSLWAFMDYFIDSLTDCFGWFVCFLVPTQYQYCDVHHKECR